MSRRGNRSDAELRVPRRATELLSDGTRDTQSLTAWREVDAYVLLGDPGAGKSESLKDEAIATGGVYISARDFIALGVEQADANRTLFIDGLDEVRAGAPDGRVPLDAIRHQLKTLGYPRFRLSCREHDWRSQSDQTALAQVAPGGVVHELHLEPLSREEQHQVLSARKREIPDAPDFLERGDQFGVSVLFGVRADRILTTRADRMLTRGGSSLRWKRVVDKSTWLVVVGSPAVVVDPARGMPRRA